MLAGTAAVTLATALGIGIVYYLSSHNRILELRSKMSSIIEQSELVAANMDDMHSSRVFDMAGTVQASKTQAGGRSLQEVYATTPLYKTIPIVAAWKSVEGAAKKNGFEFFTPSRPDVTPRNAKNNNGKDYAAAFEAFARGEKEFFYHDRKLDQLVLARPVHLRASCLSCHGEPAKSATADGKDPLGFPMENLKLDDIKGAFVLKASIGNDPIVMATMKWMALGGGLVLVVVLAGFYVFNQRSIVRPLTTAIHQIEETGAQTVLTAGEITRGSQSLAEGASEQAASLEETSASLEEMSSMTQRNAEHATRATDLARQTRAAADKGAADMQTMAAAMNDIKVSSDDIAKIIKTIDEIAFQTNLLALNAAVEAARAGEAGLGFAVVADEVRALAQRSAQAAKETAAKIEGAIRKTTQGVEISNMVGVALEDILAKARQLDGLASEVAGASKEQSQGIAQLNIAVSQMDKVTQGNAAAAEESASAAAELNSQAQSMKQAVTDLLRLVGGDNAVASGTASPVDRDDFSGFQAETEAPRHKPALAPIRERHPSPAPSDWSAPARSVTPAFEDDPLPMEPVVPQTNGKGIIHWDEASMTTGDHTIDCQHQELINKINALHAACLAGTAKAELVTMVQFLGKYAKDHFAHEEGVMQQHRCPMRGQNKAAHAQFLKDYERLAQLVEAEGASTTLVIQLKEMLGHWLTNHICKVDTSLRKCGTESRLG